MAFQDAIQKAASEAEKDAVEKLQDQLIKMYSGVFAGAMAYTNLIIIAGYGAMLAIWNFTKAHLTPWTTQAVASLLVISIGVFVGFEIIKMVSNARAILSFSRLTKPGMHYQELSKLLGDHTKGDQRRAAWLTKIWVPVLAACILTGYGAGILLVWNFISNLFAL